MAREGQPKILYNHILKPPTMTEQELIKQIKYALKKINRSDPPELQIWDLWTLTNYLDNLLLYGE